MKKLFILVTIIFCFTSLYAESKFSIVEEYKDNYIVFGNNDDQVLAQVSLKISLFKPGNMGFYFGYSQYMYWSLYKWSSPFRDINFNPEIFWNWKFDGFLNYLQVGLWEHESNGKDGTESRSINQSYIEAQVSTRTKLDIGLNVKVAQTFLIDKTHNGNIGDYTGYYTAKVFFNFNFGGSYTDNEKLYISWHQGKTDVSKGAYEIGVQTRLLIKDFTPKLFLLFRQGYGTEGMMEYNRKDTSLRAGILL